MSNNSLETGVKLSLRRPVSSMLMLAGLFCGQLSAQNVSTQIDQEVITIEGTRQAENGLIDAPVKVEVLNGDYFEGQQYQDLSQGVQDIPGVSVANTARNAGSASALIQGFGENSVLVMIDGVPVSQNSSFGFDLSQISTSDIEKVEVIKGGASALYGSQAMGGVINILTKRPEKKTRLELDLSSGQLTAQNEGQARNLQLMSSTSFGKWGTKLTFSQREQDAFDLDSQSIAQEGVDFKKRHGTFYIDRKISQMRAFANYIYLDGETTSLTSRPYSSSAFGAAQNITDTTTHNVKLGLEGKAGIGTLRALLNYERTDDDLTLNDNPQTAFRETFKETRFEARRLDLIYKDMELAGQKLTAGILIKEDEVNQETTTQAVEQIIVNTTDIDQKKIRSYEAYVQDTFFVNNFEFAPGVRYQYDDNFGSFAAPKVNISHYGDWKDLSFKSWVTVGTGFRAPSVKERFFTLDHTSVANYVVVGNDQLLPEESVSFQVGEEIKWGRTSLHANFFLNQVSNLIDTVERETGTSSRLFTYDNFDEVISRGVEVGIKTQLLERVAARVNYTYSETINQETNLLLANRPLHTGLVNIDYDVNDQWRLKALSRFVGAKYVDNDNIDVSPAFTTLDLRAQYRLTPKILLYSSLNNILNEVRDPAPDSVVPIVDDRPIRGREVFFGLKMEVL